MVEYHKYVDHICILWIISIIITLDINKTKKKIILNYLHSIDSEMQFGSTEGKVILILQCDISPESQNVRDKWILHIYLLQPLQFESL